MADLITPPAEHPSVAWWAACPWITDRLPTAADGDINGNVWVAGISGYCHLVFWKRVLQMPQWVHTSKWRPQPLTLGQRIDAELAANAELSPELRAILIEAKSVVGEVVK